jgi:hypothetical protein
MKIVITAPIQQWAIFKKEPEFCRGRVCTLKGASNCACRRNGGGKMEKEALERSAANEMGSRYFFKRRSHNGKGEKCSYLFILFRILQDFGELSRQALQFGIGVGRNKSWPERVRQQPQAVAVERREYS